MADNESLIPYRTLAAVAITTAVSTGGILGWHALGADKEDPNPPLALISVRSRIDFLNELSSVMTRERLDALYTRYGQDENIITYVALKTLKEDNPNSYSPIRIWNVNTIYANPSTSEGTVFYENRPGEKEYDGVCLETKYENLDITPNELREQGFLGILPEKALEGLFQSTARDEVMHVKFKTNECFFKDGNYDPDFTIEFDLPAGNTSGVTRVEIGFSSGSLSHSYWLNTSGGAYTLPIPEEYQSKVWEFIDAYKSSLNAAAK